MILTCWLETLRVQWKLQTSSLSFLAYSRLSTRGNDNNPGDLQLNDTRGTSKLTVGRRKVSLYIYIYIHYPHTRPLYYCTCPELIVRIYTHNKYSSYLPRDALLTRYNIVYYIYLYKIFSNYNFRRTRLIHKSRFACSGKSKENMSAFPPFRFWFSFEIWADRSPLPSHCPPPYQPALVIVSSLLQRHTIALRYFLRRNCSH